MIAQLVYLNGALADPASSAAPLNYQFYLVVALVALALGVWLGWILLGERKPEQPPRPMRSRVFFHRQRLVNDSPEQNWQEGFMG